MTEQTTNSWEEITSVIDGRLSKEKELIHREIMKKFPIGSIVKRIEGEEAGRKGIVVGYWNGGNGLCLRIRLETEKYEEKIREFLPYRFELDNEIKQLVPQITNNKLAYKMTDNDLIAVCQKIIKQFGAQNIIKQLVSNVVGTRLLSPSKD